MDRLMISIPKDLETEVEALKRRDFYNKSYAELYRYIIRAGLAALKANDTQH